MTSTDSELEGMKKVLMIAPLTELNLEGVEKKWNEKEEKKWKWKKWIGNEIGIEGAKEISESLKINTSLTELNLEGDEKIRNEKQRTEWNKNDR